MLAQPSLSAIRPQTGMANTVPTKLPENARVASFERSKGGAQFAHIAWMHGYVTPCVGIHSVSGPKKNYKARVNVRYTAIFIRRTLKNTIGELLVWLLLCSMIFSYDGSVKRCGTNR